MHISNDGPTLKDALAIIRTAISDGHDDLSSAISDLHIILMDHAASDAPERAEERGKLLRAIKNSETQRPVIETEQQMKNTADLIGRTKTAVRAEEDARTAAKSPYVIGGKAIDAAFKDRKAALEKGLPGMERKVLDFSRRQREEELARLRAEEEARRKAEEEARAAAGTDAPEPTPEPAQPQKIKATEPIRSKSGFTTSVRVVWRLEITDPNQLPREFLIPDERAILKALEDGKTVPGAQLVKDESLVTR